MADLYQRDWKGREDFASRHPLLALLGWAVGITVVVLIVVGVVGLVTTGSVFFQGKAAKATNPARVEKKVYDPNNTIAQIAFFHDTCQRVNAELRIAEQNAAKYKADRHDAATAASAVEQQQARDLLAQDSQDVTGAQNVVQSTVAEYNSRSAQSTANVFKGHNLPVRINLPDPIPAGYSVDCG